jgi:serine/threonine-protein kinase RsbW
MRAWAANSPGPARQIRFCLVFPREALSIPVMRHVLGDTLSRLGIAEDSVADLLLAATEACTNVLLHAGPGRGYEVVASVGRNRCVLQVVDNGHGAEAGQAGARARRLRRAAVRPASMLRRRARRTDISQLPESGRGMAIMRACVDDVSLHARAGHGTVVSLRRRIEWRPDAPLRQLLPSGLRDAS